MLTLPEHASCHIATEARTRRYVGIYEIDLHATRTGWRISCLQFKVKFVDGNLELETAT